MKITVNKLNIPVGLIKHINTMGIKKPFACYLLLKFLFTGKVHENLLNADYVMSILGIKDPRTFRKYISILLKHQFLNYNPKSGYYFIRSFERLREIHNLKDRTSVLLYFDKFNTIQSFIDTAIVGQLIQNQEYFWLKGPDRFRRPAINKMDVANTVVKVDRSKKPAYFGLSNHTIAKNLNCSLSQACKRKHKAEKAGLLETKGHFVPIYSFPKADKQVRSQIYTAHPQLINRLRFRKIKNAVTGRNEVQLVQQLHDEIKPLIKFSRRKRIVYTVTSKFYLG